MVLCTMVLWYLYVPEFMNFETPSIFLPYIFVIMSMCQMFDLKFFLVISYKNVLCQNNTK